LSDHGSDKNKHKQSKKLSISKSYDHLYLQKKDKKEINNLYKTIKPKRLRLYECLSSSLQSKDLILLDTKFMKTAKIEKIYELKFRSFDQINNKEADNEVKQLMQIRRHSCDAQFVCKKSPQLSIMNNQLASFIKNNKTEKEQPSCRSSNVQYPLLLSESIKDTRVNQQDALFKDSKFKCIDDSSHENNLFDTREDDKQVNIKSNSLITKIDNSNVCFSDSSLNKCKDTCCETVLKSPNDAINRSHDLANCEEDNTTILLKSKKKINHGIITKDCESKFCQINSTDAHSSTTTSGSFEINDSLSDYMRERKLDLTCEINFENKLLNNFKNLKKGSSCLSLESDNAENKNDLFIDQIDITGESSQATEKDLAMSEYSLQHSSDEISQKTLSQSEGHTNTFERFDQPKCILLS